MRRSQTKGQKKATTTESKDKLLREIVAAHLAKVTGGDIPKDCWNNK